MYSLNVHGINFISFQYKKNWCDLWIIGWLKQETAFVVCKKAFHYYKTEGQPQKEKDPAGDVDICGGRCYPLQPTM
jgi:hypothetical protein